MKKETISPISVLLHVLDEAYGRPAWHGPHLRGALKGVSARQAGWRPAPDRHNIRELAMHAAYWKDRVRRRLTGEKRGAFALPGSNWLDLAEPTERSWRRERALLDRMHELLRAVVEELPDDLLTRPLPATRGRTALREIAGIALHDVYHTGQIQLLKAVSRQRRRKP